jgi:hypothetical protein
MPNNTNGFRVAHLSLAVAALGLATCVAQAGTITGVNSIVGPGLGTVNVPVILTPSEGNDNQPGGPGFDANIVVPIKRFDNTGIIDIVFNVRNSDAEGTVTEYEFFESVDNNTGINWDLYTMQLGAGTGAGFVISNPGDGLDFDFPTFDPAPTSTAFPIVGLAEDTLTFSGGIHSTGSEIYEIRIDVPNGIQTFTLRQFPRAVPEPTSLVLAALGCLALVGWRFRSRSR